MMKLRQVLSWVGCLSCSVVVGFGLGLAIKTTIFAKSTPDSKKVISLAPTIDPQVKFSDILVGSQNRKIGERFEAGQEWLYDLSFRVENVSKRPIAFLQVNVNFPETRATGNLMSYTIYFGEMPGKKYKGSKPMLLKPGEAVNVDLESEKSKLARFIGERQPIDLISEIELEIGFVAFEDGTAWSSGKLVRPDPDRPGRFRPVSSIQN
jgi:hypothetical protein